MQEEHTSIKGKQEVMTKVNTPENFNEGAIKIREER